MSERLVFGTAIEAMYLKALAGRRTPALDRKLEEAGLDLAAPLKPAYPALQVAEWTKLAARELYPNETLDEGLRQLGLSFVEGWAQTLLGRASTAMIKLIGPHRAMARLTRTFRTTDNFTETTYRELSPTSGEVTFNHEGQVPTYYLGILQGGAKLLDVKDARVTMLRRAPPTYRAEWA